MRVLAAVMAGICAAGAAAEPELPPPPDVPPTEAPERIGKLERLKPEERTLLLHQYTFERQRLVEVLLKKLESSSSETRVHAAYLIGLWRLEQAPPHLVRRLTEADDRVEQRRVDGLWFWGRYPFAEALVRIGEPSSPVLIEVLASSDDAEARALAARCLRRIHGVLASAALAAAQATENTPARRARLEAALPLLDQAEP